MEWLAELLTGTTVLIGAIVALIISILKGKKEIETNLPTKIKCQSTINIEINEQLEKLKELVNADRVQVYDFHNGGHYANGRSALKTSCTFEVTRIGIKASQMHLQNIPLSCIAKFTSHLLENDYIDINNLEQIKDIMPATYQLKKDLGITSFYDIILNNDCGEPIGFLAVQYVKNNYGIITEEDKENVAKIKYFVEDKLCQMITGC